MCQADIVSTGRDKPLIDPVMTEVALVGDVLAVVIGDGIVGAFGNAGLAAGAAVGIQDHDAVIALADRIIRASVCAGRIVAVAAQAHLEPEVQLTIHQPGAVFFNPDQSDTLRCPILLLAGHLTGLAAPAEVVIYSYFKSGHDLRLYLLSSNLGISEYIKEWILFLLKTLDRIYRINRIVVRFPDETLQIPSACRRKELTGLILANSIPIKV